MNWLLKLLGYTYLLNKNTYEIHNLENVKTNCGLNYSNRKNFKRITRSKMLNLMKQEKYDGCRHCLTKYDTK